MPAIRPIYSGCIIISSVPHHQGLPLTEEIVIQAVRTWFRRRSWGSFRIDAEDGVPQRISAPQEMKYAEQVDAWQRLDRSRPP